MNRFAVVLLLVLLSFPASAADWTSTWSASSLNPGGVAYIALPTGSDQFSDSPKLEIANSASRIRVCYDTNFSVAGNGVGAGEVQVIATVSAAKTINEGAVIGTLTAAAPCIWDSSPEALFLRLGVATDTTGGISVKVY